MPMTSILLLLMAALLIAACTGDKHHSNPKHAMAKKPVKEDHFE
jgi:outer membrane biogenesis lipoprotein LolB|tara:strand:+ start:1156 stop:1287 length:132 start_codon:yes stop_codon:yes gene_type:complete